MFFVTGVVIKNQKHSQFSGWHSCAIFFADAEYIARSSKIELNERQEPVALSLLMEGEEDVEFWWKLWKNTKSNTDNKTELADGTMSCT